MKHEQMMLDKKISSVKEHLKHLPSGKLVCSQNGEYQKWYQSDGHKKTYIPKSNKQLAEKLAIKKYLSLQLEDLENEKKAIELERKKAIAKNPKKYQELKAVADKYLAQEPKTAQNYIAAASTYKQLGETTNAIRILKNAMKVEPTNSDIYYHLGLAYFEQNDTTNAKTNLTKSINLDRENTKSQNLLAFVNQKIITQTINKAYNLYQAKNYVSAFEILDKGIKDYPDNSHIKYKFAQKTHIGGVAFPVETDIII